MKYVVIDQTRTDCFTKEFETKEEAIKEGEYQFGMLTSNDKKRREAFYVLESANPDEEAENHFDGNLVKEWI